MRYSALQTPCPLVQGQTGPNRSLACSAGTRPRKPSGRLITSSVGCTSTTEPQSLAPMCRVCEHVTPFSVQMSKLLQL